MKQIKQKQGRTNHRTEEVVKLVRLELYNQAVCCEAQAIQRRMEELEERVILSARTIGRILARHGLTHGRTGIYPGEEDRDFRLR
jgi:hypothetical protein